MDGRKSGVNIRKAKEKPRDIKSAPKESKKAKSAPPQPKSNEKERSRKVYEFPGQTRDTPPEGDPLRKFYMSLLEQVPSSEMARRWCVIHGLLPQEEAEAWVQEQTKKKGVKSPTKKVGRVSSGNKRTRTDAMKDGRKKAKSAPPSARTSKPTAKETKPVEKKNEKNDRSLDRPVKEEDGTDKIKCSVDKSGDGKRQTAAVGSSGDKKGRILSVTNRDVAFVDGGLDGSDSEDDIPLLQRKL